MKLRHLGTDTRQGGSPALYASDRDTYVVQGWRTGTDDRIEIPHTLLAKLERGTCLGSLLADTGHGTFVMSGLAVTDDEALARLRIPDHEAAVEVPIGTERRPDDNASLAQP